MSTHTVDDFVRSAKLHYEQKLRAALESEHRNEFVAIEPVSGDDYLGHTLSESLGAARKAHPDRLSHVIQIGHRAALHFGVHLS